MKRVIAIFQDDTVDKSAIFRQAGLIISPSDVQLGDIIGHGEFGGEGNRVIGNLNRVRVRIRV